MSEISFNNYISMNIENLTFNFCKTGFENNQISLNDIKKINKEIQKKFSTYISDIEQKIIKKIEISIVKEPEIEEVIGIKEEKPIKVDNSDNDSEKSEKPIKVDNSDNNSDNNSEKVKKSIKVDNSKKKKPIKVDNSDNDSEKSEKLKTKNLKKTEKKKKIEILKEDKFSDNDSDFSEKTQNPPIKRGRPPKTEKNKEKVKKNSRSNLKEDQLEKVERIYNEYRNAFNKEFIPQLKNLKNLKKDINVISEELGIKIISNHVKENKHIEDSKIEIINEFNLNELKNSKIKLIIPSIKEDNESEQSLTCDSENSDIDSNEEI